MDNDNRYDDDNAGISNKEWLGIEAEHNLLLRTKQQLRGSVWESEEEQRREKTKNRITTISRTKITGKASTTTEDGRRASIRKRNTNPRSSR